MKKQLVPLLIRVLLVFMMAATVLMALCWVPDAVSHIGNSTEILRSVPLRYTVYVLAAAVALLSLVIFFCAFHYPSAIAQGTVFTKKTAVHLRLTAHLVLCDCILFSLCVLLLLLIGERLLAPALAFFSVIGYTISALLFVLSGYVRDAASLKEEADLTL